MAQQPVNFFGGNTLQSYLDTAQGLQGLERGALQNQALSGQFQQQQSTNQRKEEARAQVAEVFRNNDPAQIAEFSLENPEYQQLLFAAGDFVSGRSRQSKLDASRNIVLGADPDAELAKSGQIIVSEGGNPEDTLAMMDQPSNVKKAAAEKMWASLDSVGYTSYKSSIGSDDDGRTPRQKEFDQYTELKKSDPEAARQLGMSSGFVKPDQGNRLFQVRRNDDGTTTKYFADGSEQVVPASEKVKTPDMKTAMSQAQAIKIVDKAKEGQLKNAGFAITLNDGLNEIDSLIAGGYDPMSAAWVNKYLAGTTLGNIAMSEEDQLYSGAVEQMINSIARRETGAAITEFERKDFFNRFMPMAADSPKRVQQKKDALERQFKSIRGQSGSVYDAIRVTQGIGGRTSEETTAPEASTQESFSEGQTATSPDGRKAVYTNGQWVVQ